MATKLNYLVDVDNAARHRLPDAAKAAKKARRKARKAQQQTSQKQIQKPATVRPAGFVFDPKVTYPYKPGMHAEFYSTAEWRKLRFTVLRESGAACVVCGQSRASGHVMHVDHIKPRSKFPGLELVKSNLQVLCADCNWGKGSRVL